MSFAPFYFRGYIPFFNIYFERRLSGVSFFNSGSALAKKAALFFKASE